MMRPMGQGRPMPMMQAPPLRQPLQPPAPIQKAQGPLPPGMTPRTPQTGATGARPRGRMRPPAGDPGAMPENDWEAMPGLPGGGMMDGDADDGMGAPMMPGMGGGGMPVLYGQPPAGGPSMGGGMGDALAYAQAMAGRGGGGYGMMGAGPGQMAPPPMPGMIGRGPMPPAMPGGRGPMPGMGGGGMMGAGPQNALAMALRRFAGGAR